MIEEIHLSDKTLRNDFISYWNDNDYSSAYQLLSNSQLNNKKLIAALFNSLTNAIVTLENNDDPTFKEYRIEVSSEPPSGLSSGQLWFQSGNEVIDAPTIITQPTNVIVNVGEVATFTVIANGTDLLYQWWYMKPDETIWNKVTVNGTNPIYNLTTQSRHNNYQYKCVIQNNIGSVTTNIVTLTVV